MLYKMSNFFHQTLTMYSIDQNNKEISHTVLEALKSYNNKTK